MRSNEFSAQSRLSGLVVVMVVVVVVVCACVCESGPTRRVACVFVLVRKNRSLVRMSLNRRSGAECSLLCGFLLFAQISHRWEKAVNEMAHSHLALGLLLFPDFSTPFS